MSHTVESPHGRTDLTRFLAPKSFALVGATDDTSRFAGRVLMRMANFGYQGEIIPVHPKLQKVRGLQCYPSVRELPHAPDHVGIVVPAEHVLNVLEDCASRGAKFATVFAGGFGETGTASGHDVEAKIAALARKSGMRVMGPNCNGLVNFVDGFACTTSATIAGPRKPAGDIGVVAQSGGAGQVNVMWRAQELGLGVSYEVSCGNSADLNILDFIEFMIEDPVTRVITVLAEEIPDGRRLIELAHRAADREKPIVLMKLGRTEAGSRAAQSHTGAVAGSDQICDAALRQCGIVRVEDCNELYETAMLLRTKKWPRGTRVGAMSVSGGNGVILTDLGAHIGLSLPEFSSDTQSRLTEVLPKLAGAGNPVDFTNAALGKPNVFQHCVEAIAADSNVDAVVSVLTMSPKSDLEQMASGSAAIDKPFAMVWIGACNDDASFTARNLIEKGLPVYRNTFACLKALRASARFGEFLNGRSAKPSARPADVQQAAASEGLKAGSDKLTERSSKQVLAAYGIAATREALAPDAQAAVGIARDLAGPVALKIESADILHKTEAGAIRLNVHGDEAVTMAFNDVRMAAQRYLPSAKIDGVLVQEMAPAGLEMIVGLTVDPVFGPVIMAGLGGIHVEVLKDVAYRVAPIDVEQAKDMLRELRAYKLLEGVRGAKPRDIDALGDAISRISWLGADLRNEIAELDVNPLLVRENGRGVLALDALIVKQSSLS